MIITFPGCRDERNVTSFCVYKEKKNTVKWEGRWDYIVDRAEPDNKVRLALGWTHQRSHQPRSDNYCTLSGYSCGVAEQQCTRSDFSNGIPWRTEKRVTIFPWPFYIVNKYSCLCSDFISPPTQWMVNIAFILWQCFVIRFHYFTFRMHLFYSLWES